jgi:hypothetical protein
MKDFVYNDDYCLLDPYVVEGEERLHRFIHNFRAQEPYGVLGALGQGSIFIEAQHYLSPELFSRFCDCIGMPVGSSGFAILRALADIFRQSGVVFDERLFAAAIIRLSPSGRNFMLERMLEDGHIGPDLRATRRAA